MNTEQPQEPTEAAGGASDVERVVRRDGNTIRVMRLYRWKNNVARRAAIVATFPLLLAANIVLATIGWVLFGLSNQRELLRTSKHYWNSSERIDAPNGEVKADAL